MIIEEQITKIRRKLNEGKPCPTPVLLYIAAEWNYHSDVEPWYGQIKELTGGVDKNNIRYHKAVICAMFPEFENAAAYFAKNAQLVLDPIKSDDPHAWRKRSYKQKLINVLQKVEKETIDKFNLKPAYDIYHLTDKQKTNITARIKSQEKADFDEARTSWSPVVQKLSQKLYDKVSATPHYPLAFVGMMDLLNDTLQKGEQNNSEPKYNDITYPMERYKIAKEIFKMQHDGILDEKFNIKDEQKFNDSELVKNFSYQGKNYNLSDSSQTNGMALMHHSREN